MRRAGVEVPDWWFTREGVAILDDLQHGFCPRCGWRMDVEQARCGMCDDTWELLSGGAGFRYVSPASTSPAGVCAWPGLRLVMRQVGGPEEAL